MCTVTTINIPQVELNRQEAGRLLRSPKITEVMVIRTMARYLTAGEMKAVVNELELDEGSPYDES